MIDPPWTHVPLEPSLAQVSLGKAAYSGCNPRDPEAVVRAIYAAMLRGAPPPPPEPRHGPCEA